MSLSQDDFNKAEVHDEFYGFSMYRTPKVTRVSEENGRKILWVQWDKDHEIPCLWDETVQQVVTADGSENKDVQGLNEQYAKLCPEDVHRLARKWRDTGILSPENFERLLLAAGQTSSSAMNTVMSS